MKMYVRLKYRKGLALDDGYLDDMIDTTKTFLAEIFPNVDIISDSTNYTIPLIQSNLHEYIDYCLNLTERDINKAKLINNKAFTGLVNDYIYVDNILLLNGSLSTVSSYYATMVIIDDGHS